MTRKNKIEIHKVFDTLNEIRKSFDETIDLLNFFKENLPNGDKA